MSILRADPLRITVATWPGNAKAAWTCTFDDALRDQYTHAVPLLNEHQLPATFFVLAKTAETTEEAEKKKPGSWGTITWEEMKMLIAQGHEIGNHSWSHADFRRIPEENLKKEIFEAQKRIGERVGVVPTTFCFPFNAITETSLRKVAIRHHAWRTHIRQFGGPVRAAQASRWLDEEEGRSGWTVLMVHGLLNGYDAFQDPAQFALHLKEVAKRRDAGDLWPATFRDVAAYKAMREETTLQLTPLPTGALQVKLKSTLPQERWTPLTLVIEGASPSLVVKQGDKVLPLVRKEDQVLVTTDGTALEISP